jgi:lipopolysaccharide transport system permease protein
LTDSEKITIYEPDSKHKIGFFRIWATMLSNIVHSRDLIFQLFRRDFVMAYRKSFIGIGWIFLQPVFGIISWVIMNAAGVLNPGDVGIPYPAYVLLSTTIWSLFVGFYNAASETLGAGSGIILQVKYPHEVLLIKQTAQHLANFILGFSLTIVVLLIFGVVPSWKIIFFPVIMLPMFFLGAGIGLVVSVFKVVIVDLQSGFNFILTFLMLLTPVVYSQDINNGVLQEIMKWNPLTYMVCSLRDITLYGTMGNIEGYLYSALFAFVIFLLSWKFFFVAEDKVIEKIF